MRVLLVTSWETACGINEHSKLLIEAVQQADPKIEIRPDSAALDPTTLWRGVVTPDYDLIHLNHHDGLHSRWAADDVRELTSAGVPVLITYHDSRATLAECPKLEALAKVASSVVVHEPVEGLKAIYWRQGVPAAAQAPAMYGGERWYRNQMVDGEGRHREQSFKDFPQQPVLGTVGWNFPWKNYARLAQITGEEGWALVLLSHNATEEDEVRWRALNSSIFVVRKFLSQDVVVNYLAGCDATAFMYECANTGTSAAIRQGIAARKPVIALESCRQFRDLYEEFDGPGGRAIDWVGDWEEFRSALHHVHGGHVCPTIHALAHRDSWKVLGENYAKLYHTLVSR